MHDHGLSEEQRLMRQSCRGFVDDVVIPFMRRNWRISIVILAVIAMLLPGVKLVEGGVLRQDLWQMIMGMTRLPHVLGLDLKAMIAANNVAARRLVELHGGDADIHHDAVHGIKTLRGANLGQMGEAILDQRQPAAGLLDQIEPAGNGVAVAVDANHPATAGLENRTAIAAGAEGGIDIDLPFARLQLREHLAKQHGNMA